MIKSDYEKQMNAVMRFLTAESEEDREQARADMCAMMGGKAVPAEDGQNVECTVERVLLDLGVPCHIKGYNYLITAISLVVCDEELIESVTKGIYPSVAEKYGTTPSRVERAVRHAIECGWDRIDIDVMIDYFGNTISANKGKPTNSEFIARVANVVRSRVEEAS